MPVMYMPVTDDAYELHLAPLMPSRAAVARWGGLAGKSAWRRDAGETRGFLIVGVRV